MYVRVLVSRAELSRELVHSTLLQIRLARHCFSLSPRATKKKPVERLPHSLAVAYHVRLPVKITHYRHLARILISLSLPILYCPLYYTSSRRKINGEERKSTWRAIDRDPWNGTRSLSPLLATHNCATRRRYRRKVGHGLICRNSRSLARVL